MNIEVFTWIGGGLDSLVTEILFPAVAAVMDAVRPVVYVGVMIYVIFIGLAISGRSGNQSAGSLIFTGIKVSVIVTLALKFTTYQHYVIDVINNFYTTVAAALSGSSDATSIYAVLDGLLGKGAGTSSEAFQKMDDVGMFNIGPLVLWTLAALAILFGTIVITLGGGAIIVGAFLMIMVLTAIGPIFIAASLFPLTSKFTVSWISTVLTQCLNIIITSVIMAFAVRMFGGILKDIDTSQALGFAAPIAVIVQTAVIVGVLKYVIGNIGSLSASLSGGLSTAAMTVRDVAESYRAPMRAINPESTRRDMATNLPIKDTRGGHIRSGNAASNPAYIKRGWDNAGRHYGFRNKGKIKGK